MLVTHLEKMEAGMTVHPGAITMTARPLGVANGLLKVGLAKTLYGEHNGTNQEVKEGLHEYLSRDRDMSARSTRKIRQALMLPNIDTFDNPTCCIINLMSIEKQSDKPLYEDILWSRPVRRTGRVLLVGGHRDGFAELQKLYQGFEDAQVAECHLALPDKLSKLVGNLEGISLLASNPSGSIARDALAELVHLADESDLVSLGPDLSNNSETTLVMQRLITETHASILIPPQSAEQLLPEAGEWKDKQNLLLVINHRQLYKLATKLAVDTTIPLSPTGDSIAGIALSVSKTFLPSLVITFEDSFIIAVGGKASITKANTTKVGLLATFWLQNSTKHYEALTTAAYLINNPE